MTIAGACLHDYRLNRKEEDTIASKPVKGWRLITNECEELNVNANVFIAAFTACWERLRLYEALDFLGKQVLYYDTDSVLYVHRLDQSDVTLGECQVKGHSLDVEGMAQPNYEVLRQNTLDKLQHPLETPRKTGICQAHKIIQKSKQYEIGYNSMSKYTK